MMDRRGGPKMHFGFQSLALSVLVAATLLGCSPTGRPSAHAIISVPPQGIYESCPPHDTGECARRLEQIADAGFQLVINYDQLQGSAAQQLSYAATAHSLGLQLIWGMSNPAFRNGTDLRRYYAELGATCGCTDNAGFVRYVVDLVKDLPATWGYYIGDEAKPEQDASVRAFADLVRQLDPAHPRLYIAGNISNGDPSKVEPNLAPFVDTAEVIGVDFYPISTSRSVDAIGPIANAVQALADRSGRESALVLQAFSWGQYSGQTWVCSPFPRCARFPTASEMRQMRDYALSYAHPALLLWYSYFDIVRSDDPSRHWLDLKDAAVIQNVGH